jgi:ABC-type ATPase with predicted acetyltransferase domain
VVFDGDYCDDDPYASNDKRQSCRQQTVDCVQKLELHDCHGNPRYTYGDPSVVLDSAAVFQMAIEDELSLWPSFQEVMRPANHDKPAKRAYRYRRAARSANAEDMPPFLRSLVEQIVRASDPS